MDAAVKRGVKARSVVTLGGRLRNILGPATGAEVGQMTHPRARGLYDALVETGVATDTHRNALSSAKAWGRWCVGEGYLGANPFADVEGTGRRKHGKPQLTVSESRKLLATCIAEATRPQAGAIATMAYLLLGCRAEELLKRKVRDLDDDGRLLWIREAKTRSGERRLEVPEVLRPFLLAMAEGKRPEDDLFGQSRQWAHGWVGEMCKRAGVRIVPPHGLRGTHATLATMAGATGPIVSEALGHATGAVTEKHYTTGEATENARQRASWSVLEGGRR